MGTENRPSREPMAWLAPWGPHRSKAMGPIRVTKQPSKRPMTAQMRRGVETLQIKKHLTNNIFNDT